MVIHQVTQNLRLPIIGKIRLGEKKLTQGGKEYPITQEHFILKDQDGCASVRKVYGDEPESLDIVFSSNDENKVIPTWLKWYGAGRKLGSGETLPGRLKCYGPGPLEDGTPGNALYLDKRDPLTGISPSRPCMGARCPDWKDQRGIQQCKQQMSVFVILPLISWDGVFQIDTTSWNSINDFASYIAHQKATYGAIAGRPYKIIRQEKMTTFVDPSGQQKQGKQYIMRLKSNPEFIEKHSGDVAALLDSCKKNTFLSLPSAEELIMLPTSSAYSLEQHTEDIEEDQTQQIQTAEDVVKDPEVAAAFDEYERVIGAKFNKEADRAKDRLVRVRKKTGAEDLKAAVLKAIADGIAIVRAKAMSKMVNEQAPAPIVESASPQTEPAVELTPPVDTTAVGTSEGIM